MVELVAEDCPPWYSYQCMVGVAGRAGCVCRVVSDKHMTGMHDQVVIPQQCWESTCC